MKIEVTEGMAAALRADPSYLDEVFAHHDFQRQLRDLVLAAIPSEIPEPQDAPGEAIIGHNECRAETIANINALFDKENGNG